MAAHFRSVYKVGDSALLLRKVSSNDSAKSTPPSCALQSLKPERLHTKGKIKRWNARPTHPCFWFTLILVQFGYKKDFTHNLVELPTVSDFPYLNGPIWGIKTWLLSHWHICTYGEVWHPDPSPAEPHLPVRNDSSLRDNVDLLGINVYPQ